MVKKMRGRKIDSEFLSNFIAECVSKNKITQKDIALEAKSKISEIDTKIQEVETLKKIRSKLLDVVFTFDDIKKSSKNDIGILPFFKINNLHICKFICDLILKDHCKITDLKNNDTYKNSDIIFCIKQLIKYNIILRINDNFTKGKEFDNFMQFILKK